MIIRCPTFILRTPYVRRQALEIMYYSLFLTYILYHNFHEKSIIFINLSCEDSYTISRRGDTGLLESRGRQFCSHRYYYLSLFIGGVTISCLLGMLVFAIERTHHHWTPIVQQLSALALEEGKLFFSLFL